MSIVALEEEKRFKNCANEENGAKEHKSANKTKALAQMLMCRELH